MLYTVTIRDEEVSPKEWGIVEMREAKNLADRHLKNAGMLPMTDDECRQWVKSVLDGTHPVSDLRRVPTVERKHRLAMLDSVLDEEQRVLNEERSQEVRKPIRLIEALAPTPHTATLQRPLNH